MMTRLAELLHILMYLHAGFPELYDPVYEIIKVRNNFIGGPHGRVLQVADVVSASSLASVICETSPGSACVCVR